ncbi:hypothetical protein MVEN_00743600 [Mycena venus]|uniref:Uncharacterized protein n=1 Tax=Mycena venus TaxID=2733690 RepID=A0A8H6YK40_9AGAR|nr:hypothetical protein MVEN_00743600 [Mycena venus]
MRRWSTVIVQERILSGDGISMGNTNQASTHRHSRREVEAADRRRRLAFRWQQRWCACSRGRTSASRRREADPDAEAGFAEDDDSFPLSFGRDGPPEGGFGAPLLEAMVLATKRATPHALLKVDRLSKIALAHVHARKGKRRRPRTRTSRLPLRPRLERAAAAAASVPCFV